MSILSQKSDIFDKIATIKTANELQVNTNNISNFTSSFDSSKTKNNKDPFLFSLDLLKVLSGSESTKIVTTTIFNVTNKIESSFKGNLKNEIQSLNGGSKSNPSIPSNLSQGYNLHINKIDYYNQLISSNNSNGMYLDPFKTQLVNTMKTPNTFMNINPALQASFNDQTGFFTFKPSSTNTNISLNGYMSSLIDNTNFIDNKALINNSLGNVFNSDNKTKDQLSLESQIDLMLNKLATETADDDSYFTFTTDEMGDIQSTINNNGNLVTNVGSTGLTVQLSNNDVNGITSGITFPISSTVLDNTLNSTINVINSNNEISQQNKQSVSNSFASNFLSAIKGEVIKSFMSSPQINIIYGLSQSFNTNSDTTSNPVNDIVARKNLTKCLISQLLSDLVKTIFQLIEKEIISLVSAVALIYIEEGIDKYKKILQSLI